jgi:predicted alpha-1,2-mannosidase
VIRKTLKYFLAALTALLTIFFLVILVFFVRYKITTGRETGGLVVTTKPGEFGQWVDPFIGTGGFPPYTSADDIPGVTLPFGMVKLSPDTRYFLNFDRRDPEIISTAGYYYGDSRLMGFSHTRMTGTGAAEGGHFRVIPAIGENAMKDYRRGRFSRFSHKAEVAFPGYYAVKLPDAGVLAELTASEHAGFHRYTFSKNAVPHILIDVSSNMGCGKTAEGSVQIDPVKQEIAGAIKTFGSFAGRYGGIKVYFIARFDQPFKGYSEWSDDKIGVDLLFEKTGDQTIIGFKMGISYVSPENARENLDTEAGNSTFDEMVAKATDAWEKKLSLVKIESDNSEQKKIFYTALYHSLQMPTLFTDVKGDYRGFDKKVHKAEGFRYFTDLSLWDTYRTVHPLLSLIQPDNQLDMVRSLVKMCEQGGVLPRWPSGYGYTGSMLGASADIMITDTYLKGLRDFDVDTVYRAMLKAALVIDVPKEGFKPREGMKDHLEFRYCPSDKMYESVSKTIEYSYADDAISKLAAALGLQEDSKLFLEHSHYYRNVWNPETQYFHPRKSSGEVVKEFKPLKLTYLDFKGKYTNAYVEGSALQWRWAPFFDADGLIDLFRNKEYFVNELNDFFSKSNPKRGALSPGPYYWHGNEPDIHAAYLFNYAGRPDLTQKWVRWILENKYGAEYDGIDGDDDAGTLSAWYIFSALGFYPVAGSDIYLIGAPLFEKAEMMIGDKMLTIEADNFSPGNLYVRKVTLNGQVLDRWWFRHSEIANGGILRFEMSKELVIF